jgi:uncharacterized protein (DUF305 family)
LILAVGLAGCGPAGPAAPVTPPGGGAQAAPPAAVDPALDPELDPDFDRVEGTPADTPTDPTGEPGAAAPGEGLPGAGWTPGQEPETPAGFTVTGTPADRAFIDELVPQLLFGLAVLDRVQEHAAHAELKELAARLKPDWQAKVKQLRAHRLAWFGSARVPAGEQVDMSYLAPGAEFDWMAGNEIMFVLQSGLEAAQTASQGQPHDEITQLAAAITSAWTPDRDRLNAWVSQWLSEAPTPGGDEPAE